MLIYVLVGLVGTAVLLAVAATLFALPAMATLPAGLRPGLADLTLDEAAARLRASGATGWALVEEARALVGARMAYCRRNSFDPYRRAFRRGYGYCQQTAYALAGLLQQLGFEAWTVHCEKTRFPNRASPTGHAWVRVSHQAETRDVDPHFQDAITGALLFEPAGPVRAYTTPFRLLAGWGSAIANAYRYYRTGSDEDPGY